MTLKEYKEKKEKLERDLLKLIMDFENDTGAGVSYINPVHIFSFGKEHHTTVSVSVDVKI